MTECQICFVNFHGSDFLVDTASQLGRQIEIDGENNQEIP